MAWLHCSTQPVRERWFAVNQGYKPIPDNLYINQNETASRIHYGATKKSQGKSNPINLTQNHIFDNLSAISLCAQETRDVRAESKLRSTSQKRQSSWALNFCQHRSQQWEPIRKHPDIVPQVYPSVLSASALSAAAHPCPWSTVMALLLAVLSPSPLYILPFHPFPAPQQAV